MKRVMTTWALLALGTSWAAGCAPGKVDGDVVSTDYELGSMSTVYFDTYDDGSGISYFYLASYKWSCEEIQDAEVSGTPVTTDDPEEVVGYVLFSVNKFNSTSDFYAPAAEEGDYRILDDLRDVAELSDGTLYGFGYFGFYNDLDTVDILLAAENGTLTLEKVDLEKSISASFSVSLSDGSQLTGSFKADYCAIPD